MKMTDIWTLYEADKRILGFSPYTLKAYSLQLERLKPSSLGHRIRSLFRSREDINNTDLRLVTRGTSTGVV